MELPHGQRPRERAAGQSEHVADYVRPGSQGGSQGDEREAVPGPAHRRSAGDGEQVPRATGDPQRVRRRGETRGEDNEQDDPAGPVMAIQAGEQGSPGERGDPRERVGAVTVASRHLLHAPRQGLCDRAERAGLSGAAMVQVRGEGVGGHQGGEQGQRACRLVQDKRAGREAGGGTAERVGMCHHGVLRFAPLAAYTPSRTLVTVRPS